VSTSVSSLKATLIKLYFTNNVELEMKQKLNTFWISLHPN